MGNFVYDTYVTGHNFIGRAKESAALGNMIRSGENTVIYEPPYSGKRSIVQNVLLTMEKNPAPAVFGMNLDNVRSLSSLLLKFGSSVIRNIATTPEEYKEVIQKYLTGTHFIFDYQRFSVANEAVSLNWDPDENDIVHMLRLPSLVAAETCTKTITFIQEFQTINRLEDSDLILRSFKEAFKISSSKGNVFIISGSRYNEMRGLFHISPMFHGLVEHIPLPPIDDRVILEYVIKAFKPSGKEIQSDLVLGAARLFRGNMWYINHFCALCEYITRGYININVMTSALSHMLFTHKGRFEYIMDNLTEHQISFLCAMTDGVDRFTSSDVIRKYSLNSSANVARVKEALMKKEIITSNDKDELIILDPLFEYWVKRFYFDKKEEEFFQF